MSNRVITLEEAIKSPDKREKAERNTKLNLARCEGRLKTMNATLTMNSSATFASPSGLVPRTLASAARSLQRTPWPVQYRTEFRPAASSLIEFTRRHNFHLGLNAFDAVIYTALAIAGGTTIGYSIYSVLAFAAAF